MWVKVNRGMGRTWWEKVEGLLWLGEKGWIFLGEEWALQCVELGEIIM